MVGAMLWVGPCQTIGGGVLGVMLWVGPCQTVDGGVVGVMLWVLWVGPVSGR